MDKTRKSHGILVTGASDDLSPEEVEAAKQIGAMLAREGYGLIVGDWDGVDWLVREAFLESLVKKEQPAQPPRAPSRVFERYRDLARFRAVRSLPAPISQRKSGFPAPSA